MASYIWLCSILKMWREKKLLKYAQAISPSYQSLHNLNCCPPIGCKIGGGGTAAGLLLAVREGWRHSFTTKLMNTERELCGQK